MCEIIEKLCEERAHERAIESAKKMIALDTYPPEKPSYWIFRYLKSRSSQKR